jgi:hypothetical protein
VIENVDHGKAVRVTSVLEFRDREDEEDHKEKPKEDDNSAADRSQGTQAPHMEEDDPSQGEQQQKPRMRKPEGS